MEALSKRVQQVEEDVSVLKTQMDAFREDIVALRTHLRQIDERTFRGERLMMELQIEQRRASRLLEAVAEKLNVPPIPTPTPTPAPLVLTTEPKK